MINDYIKHEFEAAKRLKKGVNWVAAVNRLLHLGHYHAERSDQPRQDEKDETNMNNHVSLIAQVEKGINEDSGVPALPWKNSDLGNSTASLSAVKMSDKGDKTKRKKYKKNKVDTEDLDFA